MQPVVMISSYPPRHCGIGTFAEEAREFVQEALPDREIHVICHLDGEGENVHPIIDTSRADWHHVVAETVRKLNPYVIHIQHEYGLYNHVDHRGVADLNARFLLMLDELGDYPTVVEPHTVHGRLRESEEEFISSMAQRCSIVLFKCAYQRWRLEWTWRDRGRSVPSNIMIVPHGVRPDKHFHVKSIDQIKQQLGLADLVGRRMAGLVGWIQSNKRWDLVADMWPGVHGEIASRTGEHWLLFAAGEMRDPAHRDDYDLYVGKLQELESRGLARFYRFVPWGDIYYRVMAACDFVILPTLDETQSGTLARIIALNKPYITTAPLEGLTSQTVESDGGLLFTNRETLRRAIIRMAASEKLRWKLGENNKRYLETHVSWRIVAQKYIEAYDLAAAAKRGEAAVCFPSDI